MKQFQIFRYIRKVLPLILVVCIALTGLIYFKLSSSNRYVASEVIHYNDALAEEGKAPTGEKLDVGEIKSSAVLSKVVSRMGLTGIYSVDSLISRFTITPIPDPDKQAQKEAKLEEGEEYVYEPSTFLVSFSATNKEGQSFARAVLDETLDVYFAMFSERYVNVAPVTNVVEKLQEENYDYLEVLEIVDSSLTDTMNTLYQRSGQSPYFRSAATGLCFGDLADEYAYLQTVEISDLFAKVYKYQITKDKNILLADYKTRVDNNGLSGVKEQSVVEDIVQLIEAYIAKMRESGNTNITFEYILDTLHEKDLSTAFGGDQTVTYDELIYAWRDHNEAKEYAAIDTAYCNYVMGEFSSCTGACLNGECAASEKTCAQLNNGEYEAVRAEVDQKMAEMLDRLSTLYQKTIMTNSEYNEYMGASYISVLSTASVKASVNVMLYTLIAAVFFLVVCVGGAVVLGRMGDIISYVFYTDHLTSLWNRAWLDKYLKNTEKKILDAGTVYCAVDLSNLSYINNEFSRQIGDGLLQYFARQLKAVFEKQKTEFVYNGNGSFVILMEDSDFITAEDILALFRATLDEREEFAEIPVEYRIGIAETIRENQSARKLLASVMRGKTPYTSPAK